VSFLTALDENDLSLKARAWASGSAGQGGFPADRVRPQTTESRDREKVLTLRFL